MDACFDLNYLIANMLEKGMEGDRMIGNNGKFDLKNKLNICECIIF
jgi:hypothetical protein